MFHLGKTTNYRYIPGFKDLVTYAEVNTRTAGARTSRKQTGTGFGADPAKVVKDMMNSKWNHSMLRAYNVDSVVHSNTRTGRASASRQATAQWKQRYEKAYGSAIPGMDAHVGASLLYAVGANYNIRKLCRRDKVLPDFVWGNFVPFGKDHPMRDTYNSGISDETRHGLKSQDFQDSIDAMRKTTVAKNLMLKTKGAKADPVVCLRGQGTQGAEDLQKKIEKDWTHGGNYTATNSKVNAVFDILYHPYYDEFKKIQDDYSAKGKSKVEYMYHGTDFQAAANIIKTGYKIMPDPKAGRLLGDGIYFAKSSSKSAQYVGDRFSRSGHGVMLVTRNEMGRISPGHDINERDDSKYDSVFGNPGTQGYSLAYEEWCVKNPKACIPLQWVEVILR
jgi:hypothetical protein